MRRFVLLLPVLLVAVACGDDSPTAPSVDVPFSTTDLVVGTGPTAVPGQTLAVAYTGWLYDPTAPENKGAVFDSASTANPFTFTLGSGFVIDGWEQGLLGMQVGGLRRIIIPPELGYGSAGQGAIPGNATLIFEVELVSIN